LTASLAVVCGRYKGELHPSCSPVRIPGMVISRSRRW
jgi:hypothetical protein